MADTTEETTGAAVRLPRGYAARELIGMKFPTFGFEGSFYDLIGRPQTSGTWIVWGQSGNGKTRFTLQLAKYMTRFAKVAYDTLEEGARLSFQTAVGQSNMLECGSRFLVLHREPINTLKLRLARKHAPSVVFIDSLQFSGITKAAYIAIKEKFPNVLFVFVSHADGKEPKGSVADFIRYDADVKIRVEGFRAFSVSRYIGLTRPYTIYEAAAVKYWGQYTEHIEPDFEIETKKENGAI